MTQLYYAVSPDDMGSSDTLLNCIKSWMAVKFLLVNQDKTEVLVTDLEGKREKLLSILIYISILNHHNLLRTYV